MKDNTKLLQYICENLPKFPKVKITRPSGEIVTEVIGVRFNGKRPILSFKDYVDIPLGNSMEDVEILTDVRDFFDGVELIKNEKIDKNQLKFGKIYKIINKRDSDLTYWVIEFKDTIDDKLVSNGCVSFIRDQKSGELLIDYINNISNVWGSTDEIISIKECNESESRAFSYIKDILYNDYPVSGTISWNSIISEIN